MADELIDMGMPPNWIGYIYGCESLVYFIMCVIYPYFFNKWPRKFIFVSAFFGFAMSHVFCGPSKFLDLPKDYRLIIFGFAMLGFF